MNQEETSMLVHKNMMRTNSGSSTVEMPVALIVFLFFMLFPLIDLATIALRSCVIYSAAFNGAHAGALAPTFLNNISINDPVTGKPVPKLSAVNAAVSAAQGSKTAGLSGVDYDDPDIKVSIQGIPVKASDNLQEIRLADRTPANLVDPAYIYQLEVTVSGRVQPLFVLSDGIFGKVPGLTVPLPVTASSRQIVENPSGLTR
jgi:hypothetical protein